MSDGPHKSLDMPPGWKKLAERADNKAYAPNEVCDALPKALRQDWNAEVPEALVRQVSEIFNYKQDSLFRDTCEIRLEALRNETAGYNLASAFLDYAIEAAAHGHVGADALKEAAANTLTDRAARGARQVEEHYRRKSTHRRATSVRERIESGIYQSDKSAIAELVLGKGNSNNATGRLTKQIGLDDGVTL